jgi:hypothetical protein
MSGEKAPERKTRRRAADRSAAGAPPARTDPAGAQIGALLRATHDAVLSEPLPHRLLELLQLLDHKSAAEIEGGPPSPARPAKRG